MNEPTPPRRIGRPPKSPEGRATNNLTFRTRGSLRNKLAEAAAASGRSISEEIEHRLDQSFQQQEIVDQLRDLLEKERKTNEANWRALWQAMEKNFPERAAEVNKMLSREDAA